MNLEIVSAIVLVILNGTLILGVSLLVTSFFGWVSASMRYQILFSALLSLVLLVPASSMLPTWSVPVIPDLNLFPGSDAPEQEVTTSSEPSRNRDDEADDSPVAQDEDAASAGIAISATGRPEGDETLWRAMSVFVVEQLPWIALAVWIAGCVVILIIQLVRWAGAGFIASMASSVEDTSQLEIAAEICNELHLNKPVALLKSEMTAVTMAWGIRRPCIILPIDSENWSRERVEAVLQHEFAHIKRKDNLMHLFAVVMSAIFWFNPLVWIVMRRLNYEREVACDDQVLNSGIYASSYAKHLMDLNVRLTGPKSERIIPAVMAHSSNIKKRLLSILKADVNRRPLKPLYASLYLVVIMAFALPVAAFQPWESASDDRYLTFSGRIHSDDPDLYNIFYLDGKDCVFSPDHPLDFKLISPDAYLILNKHDELPAIRFEVRVAKDGEYRTTYYLDDKEQPYDRNAEALFHRLLKTFVSSERRTAYGRWDGPWRAGELPLAEAFNEWLESVDEEPDFSIDGKDISFSSDDPFNFKLLSPNSYFIVYNYEVNPTIRFEVRTGRDGIHQFSFYLDDKERIYDENAEALFHLILYRLGSRERSKTHISDANYSDWYRKWCAGELEYTEAYNHWLEMVDEELVYSEAYLRWKSAQGEDGLLRSEEYEKWLESREKDQILTEAFVRWMESESGTRGELLKAPPDEAPIISDDELITIGDTVDMLLGAGGDLTLDFKHVEIDVDTDWFYRFTKPSGYLIVSRIIDDVVHLYEIRNSSSGRISKRYTVDGLEYEFDETIEKRFRNMIRSMFNFSMDKESPEPN